MTSIVVNGPLGSEHMREDGEPWPFALSNGDTSVFADSAHDIIAHLIPGYGDLDTAEDATEAHDQALLLRWQTAVLTASDVQAAICGDRVHEGKFDPATESEDALTALFGDKTVAVEGFDSWDNEHVPLVLIATDYEPYTERDLPTGNVLWIDPSDEIAFLNSLANLGVIEFYIHNED